MLAVARGLMGDPRVLLVDEPVEGLVSLVGKGSGRHAGGVGKKGVTMLCVDDDTKLACCASGRVYFMDQGGGWSHVGRPYPGCFKKRSGGGEDILRCWLKSIIKESFIWR